MTAPRRGGTRTRAAAEFVVIVVGVLFALAVDSWVGQRSDRVTEEESLELVRRDVQQSVTMLREFDSVNEATRDAAVVIYRALSGPLAEVDQKGTSEAFPSVIVRRTVRVPRAAYTDLISTGNLRLIRDRRLRDEIVRYYESAEEIAVILNRNTTTFIDEGIRQTLIGSGLILPVPTTGGGTAALDDGFRALAEELGAGFLHAPDRLWSLPEESVEWDILRSQVLELAQAASVNAVLTERLASDAATLLRSLDAALDNDG